MAPYRPSSLTLGALAVAGLLLLSSVPAPASDDTPAIDPGYPSAEAAFRAVFVDSGLGARAYREDREYAAALYETPDGRWHSTPVLAGERDRSRIPYRAVPASAVRIAGAHTHGQPLLAQDPQHVYGQAFSRLDRENALYNFEVTHGRIARQFLLTSDLRILRMSFVPRAQAPQAPAENAQADAAPDIETRTDQLGTMALGDTPPMRSIAAR